MKKKETLLIFILTAFIVSSWTLYYLSTPRIEVAAFSKSETTDDKIVSRVLKDEQVFLNLQIEKPKSNFYYLKNKNTDDDKRIFLTEDSSQYAEVLIKELLRFSEPKTEVVVELRETIKLDDSEVAIVSVSFMREDSLTGSFSAIVDTETGKILKTFDRAKKLMKKADIDVDLNHGYKYQK